MHCHEIPPCARLKRNIRRWRQVLSNYPAIPLTNGGVSIPSEYSYLINDEILLQYGNKMADSKWILTFAIDKSTSTVNRTG